MRIDKKFFMTLWTVHRFTKVVTSSRTARIIDAQTSAISMALNAAMNGEAIIKLPPPTNAFIYYRTKWVETGDVRYLQLMVKNYHGEE